jgi:hypothetical protein
MVDGESCAFPLTFTLTISYTIDEEESDLAMKLALRHRANGFYVLSGTSHVPGSAVEVFLCAEHVGRFLEPSPPFFPTFRENGSVLPSGLVIYPIISYHEG